MTRIRIRAGWVVTMDDSIGDLRPGEILIEGDTIRSVSVASAEADPAEEAIDAPDMIALPGLVNSHMHTWQAGLRGLGFDWVAVDYYRNIHGTLAKKYTPDDNYIANLLGALNQLDNGVTTLFDWCHNIRDLEMAERAVDGLAESGIRAVFGHGTAKPSPVKGGDVPHARVPHPRDRVEALRKGRFASEDGLVSLALCILGPDQSTEDVTVHDFRLARELGLLSSAHVYAHPDRRLQRNGYRRLAELGLLGPDHNIVHGNYLSDEELHMIADCGVSVSSTVMLEAQFDAPVPLTARLPATGNLPALGIDVEPIVSGDMFNEMRAAMISSRAQAQIDNTSAGGPPLEAPAATTRDILRWATIGGAGALRMEDRIGSITPGKKADVILLRTASLDFVPLVDPVQALVTCGNGDLVDTVLVNGEIRKRNGLLCYPENLLRARQARMLESVARIRGEAGV